MSFNCETQCLGLIIYFITGILINGKRRIWEIKCDCFLEKMSVAKSIWILLYLSKNIQIAENTIWDLRTRAPNWFWRSSEFRDMQWKYFLILAFFINRDIKFAIRHDNLHHESQVIIIGHLMTRCILRCFERNNNKSIWVNVSIKDRYIEIYRWYSNYLIKYSILLKLYTWTLIFFRNSTHLPESWVNYI